MKVKPLFRWVGGKRHVAPFIVDHFPQDFQRYFEPFCGGAAVFLELRSRGWTRDAFLSDSNMDLINTMWCVRREPEAVFNYLRSYQQRQEVVGFEVQYREVAGQAPGLLNMVERAARFLYLLKKGYGACIG